MATYQEFREEYGDMSLSDRVRHEGMLKRMYLRDHMFDCPECGNEAEVERGAAGSHYVYCTHCYHNTGLNYRHKADAIKYWNEHVNKIRTGIEPLTIVGEI
jgi:ribosomal protein L37AE/L43A